MTITVLSIFIRLKNGVDETGLNQQVGVGRVTNVAQGGVLVTHRTAATGGAHLFHREEVRP